MNQTNGYTKPVDDTQEVKIRKEVTADPSAEDFQQSILEELKSINRKLAFFVFIFFLTIIVQFLRAIYSF